MKKIKLIGMERLTFYTVVNRIIKVIPWEGMADVFHVHTDLMGASGFQVQLCQRTAVFCLQALIMGDGRLPLLEIYFPLHNRTFRPGNRSVYYTFFRKDSLYDGKIGTLDLPVSHLLRKDGCA